MKNLFVILIVISLLAGCSASGPKFSGVEEAGINESQIYIYRTSKFLKAATYPSVYVDGVKLGPLKNGGYLVKSVTPGRYEVEIKGKLIPGDWAQKPISMNIDVKESEPTFIEMWLGNANVNYVAGLFITSADVSMAVVDKKFALPAIESCKLSK